MSDWLKELQKKAQGVKDRIGSGDLPFLKRMNLTGKNAVVRPGDFAVIRLLPRWDIKDAWVAGKDGKPVKNPKYEGGQIFLEAFEHWWDGPGKNSNRAWCLKQESDDMFGQQHDAACPLCEASAELESSHDEEDKKFGRSLKRREVFLYNAILSDRQSRKRALAENGQPDIRVLPAQNTIFVGISAIMTGDGDVDFRRGDISHPNTGFDIKLTRPQGPGDRWKVDCAQKSTPLFTDAERASAKGWVALMNNLPEWVKAEMKSYDELYKAIRGTVPESTQPQTPTAPPAEDVSSDFHGFDRAAAQVSGGSGEASAEESPGDTQAPEGGDEPWGFNL